MFTITSADEIVDVYYFQQIANEKKKLIFISPWGGAIIRNCLSSGDILNFKRVADYEQFKKENGKQLWLYLPLKVFRSENDLFAVYCCPECDSMDGTDKLSVDQTVSDIASRLCVHSIYW